PYRLPRRDADTAHLPRVLRPQSRRILQTGYWKRQTPHPLPDSRRQSGKSLPVSSLPGASNLSKFQKPLLLSVLQIPSSDRPQKTEAGCLPANSPLSPIRPHPPGFPAPMDKSGACILQTLLLLSCFPFSLSFLHK